MNLKPVVIALTAMVALTLTPPLYADDVADAVNDAMKAYRAGQFAEAASGFEYAAQLVRQQKGGALVGLLPKPLAGWEADEAETTAMGGAMGGLIVERRYNTESGEDKNVKVNITGDSPMIQSMAMMISNPMMAGADGGKLERIGGERAVVKYRAEQNRGEIMLVIGGRYLVTVNGNNVTLDELKAYTTAIDFKKLAALP